MQSIAEALASMMSAFSPLGEEEGKLLEAAGVSATTPIVRSSRRTGSLEGKVAIVTGASRGIGAAIAANMAAVTIMEERTVGPSFGQDSIDQGLRAGLPGGRHRPAGAVGRPGKESHKL